MKVKTSISLSSELIAELQRHTSDGARSEFIEKAVWSYFRQISDERRDKRDRDVLDEESPFLNNEALDALSFQAPI